MPTVVDLINRTTRIRDARFAAILPALQAQINEDFAPAWQIEPVSLHLIKRRQSYTRGANWTVWLLNTSDDTGALDGYLSILENFLRESAPTGISVTNKVSRP